MTIHDDAAGRREYSAASKASRERLLWWTLGAMLIGAYALYLGRSAHPALVGGDDHGYYAQGTLLARTGQTWFPLDSPVRFVGLHWIPNGDAQYHSRYTPGMGVMVAAFTRIGGIDSSFAINPMFAVATLVGLLLLVGQRLGPAWGVAAVVVLGVSPAFTGQAMLGGSHLAVAAALVWGSYLLLNWRERGGWWRALGAGLLLGCIPAVRPGDSIVAVGVAVFALAVVLRRERPWTHLVALGGGALLPLVPFLLYNHQTFGAAWRTAYAISREQTAFKLSYVLPHLLHEAQFLVRHGLGVFAILGAAGTLFLLRRRSTHLLGFYCAAVIGGLTLLYAAYYFVPIRTPSMSIRFLLPAFPLAVFAALALVKRVAGEWRPAVRWGAVGALLAIHAAWGIPTTYAQGRKFDDRKKSEVRVAKRVAAAVPEGSVIFSTDERVAVTLDFLQRWRIADRTLSLDAETNLANETHPRRVERARAQMKRKAAAPGKRDRKSLAPRAVSIARRTSRFEGRTAEERDSIFALDLVRWAGGNPIFFVGSQRAFGNVTSRWFAPERFEVVKGGSRRQSADGRSKALHREQPTALVIARWSPPAIPRRANAVAARAR